MPPLPVPRSHAWRCALLLALGAVAAPLAAQEADALAQRLITLRGEVEQLNGELDLLREEQRTALAALAAQKAELEAGVERQQLAAREARQKLEARHSDGQRAGVAGAALPPVLLTATEQLAAYIRGGLPFKVEERLGELETFRTQLENGSLPPPRAVNRLWAFYEDEFRLTRENSLHAQTIALGEERVLADVAKLGNMALYFRTQDGRVGLAERAAEGWRFVPLQDETARLQVEALFDALGKQIRQGYFELPLVAGGAP